MTGAGRGDTGAPDKGGVRAGKKYPPVPLRPPALVSHSGKKHWSAEYDAWGNVLREQNPHYLAQLIRLPGQQYDAETGLYYNRHRYYDPHRGRYITQDPIGLRGGGIFISMR